jgi:putative flippase GtrA
MKPPLKKNLFRFLLVGSLNTGVVYLLFKALLAMHVHYLVAGAIGWAVGVCISYVLNRTFTFEVTHKPEAKEFGAFVAGYLVQLGLGETTYWVMMGVLKFNADIAFLCNVVFTTGISFVLMRWVIFRHRPAAAGAGHV